ncbi:hypothetical protein ATX69_02505 [Oenococcus oeni]|uniref:hypothetical protein n=1 Tax=Oenococcus oeni TaxID=1247 RepID=UPI0008F87B9D|nr:hypothetical protein [Oenococcus oeni]OIM34194.1 hypothetical protein ATX69_02505 [Oenococcus oeni]
MKWTKEILEKAKSLKDQDLSYPKIAKKLNKEFYISVSASSVNHALLDYQRGKYHFTDERQKGKEDFSSKQNFDDNGNVSSIDFNLKFEDFRQTSSKKPADILRFAGYDPLDWQVSNVVNNDWSVTNGNGEKYWNHQVKLSVKPKTNDDLSIDELISLFNEKVEPVKVIKSNVHGKNNLVIACSDFHFGITKFKDVENRLVELIDLIHRGWKQIVITQLGDLLHSDALNTSKTTKGTELDPIDFVQAVRDAERFIFPIIEESYKYSDSMQMFNINGNHDETTSFMFQEMLRAKYPEMDIKVNNSYREAFVVGKSVGLLALHGHAAKTKAPMLFATEYPDIWSKSTYRMVLYGHFHKEVVNDDFGVVEHQVGTFKKSDPYESKNGYTMATKKMECFEFDDQTLKDIHYI